MGAADTLKQKQITLEEQGGDPLRVRLLACARAFKRSWVDMAEALVEVRSKRSYEAWGYEDLYAYCKQELLLKSHTVDKLTGSYRALERHAPHKLRAVADEVPPLDTVDYFARALGERERDEEPPPWHEPELVDDLKQAVFDEGRPVASIRRQFHEQLFPKSEAQTQADAVRAAQRAVRRLVALLPAIVGLSIDQREHSRIVLASLEQELERVQPTDAESAA